MGELDDPSGGERARVLDDVPELADVPRPAMTLEGGARLAREPEVVDAEPRREHLRERKDVGATLAERRHGEPEDAQPVVEILAEAAFGDERLEVADGWR